MATFHIRQAPASAPESVIKPTQVCAQIVQSWIRARGGAATSQLPSSSTDVAGAFAPRAERLGLGAKYISHAEATLSMDERKFSKKLQRGANEREQPKPKQKEKQPPKHLSKKEKLAAARRDADDDSDEEEESRASSFRLKPGKRPAGSGPPMKKQKR